MPNKIVLQNYNEQDLLILIQALSTMVLAAATSCDVKVETSHYETILVLHDQLWENYRKSQD